ncbi:MAG: alpha/beta hydrolase family protein [Bacteroidaceae bacterium]|nr:alpha/beta hydrolase family protein [Bacteroidaceae bacterium]
MIKKAIFATIAWGIAVATVAAGDNTRVTTDRTDGRFLSSRGTVQNLMAEKRPELTFDENMTPGKFKSWQKAMQKSMARIMKHPDVKTPAPRRVAAVQRDGYRVEKWESYPLPKSVVPFLVMIPDGVSADTPAPATLCIPGFGQTKELLAGERSGNYDLEGEADSIVRPAAMGLHYVRQGLVAVVVDNVSSGELSDNGYFDYIATSRFLLELGWSYLGLCSYQDRVILDWMKVQDFIRRDRIIASGFSLGTEPMMVLGLLDKSIYAFVYNDFLCRTRERALVMTKPDAYGARPFPNNIEHLIPEFLTLFDFPDIVAALAPRPVICTEGGMDRDFDIITKAYKIAGAEGHFARYHYAKYADPASRLQLDSVPEGIDRTEFFRIANVDPPHHYFKREWVMPWLKELLNEADGEEK